jgi:hypothetical protein
VVLGVTCSSVTIATTPPEGVLGFDCMDAGPRSEDLLEVAKIAAGALKPYVDSDWSRPAGPLEWSVQDTIAHMTGACAKYTIYIASRSRNFIALSCTLWPGATHDELRSSIEPVARGLATVADLVSTEVTAFHADGELTVRGFLSKACLELLVHTDDALRGLGTALPPPPVHIVEAIIRTEYPGLHADDSWSALVNATGRRI